MLNRIVKIFTENHPDRSYLVDLAVSELTVRLLRHQAREFIVSFSKNEPDNNGKNAVLTNIYKHLSEPVEIDLLCKIACMSRTKFFIEFKKVLGCSPAAFQHQTPDIRDLTPSPKDYLNE